VALPESVQDVLAVVEFARAHGLAVAPQGTEHGALSLGPSGETILLNTARMRGVVIDLASARGSRPGNCGVR
jgi:FAD/FMN-containing dehydrogenase